MSVVMSEDQITIEVDGKELSARKGQMIIEVTDANDIYIPRFCYHNKLSIAANCRMCLVEVEKAPKALPACATPVMEGMKIKTQSKAAVEAQKAIMEFLLINHPLDCPICDQGGECELQDLAMGYGQDVSRYQEKKRVVKDKNIGPLIQTDLTRCIHCTRCVRFGEEVAGLREMGATGRGENMTIGTYIEKSVDSEMSGNIIDLCPVGALTSKPFRYSARTWELIQRDTIAPHDCVGSNMHAHIKIDRLKRVVPANNEAINEVWLSDRDRFSYEGIYSDDRLTTPMIKKNGEWQEVDWDVALTEVKNKLANILSSQTAESFGVIASPSSTLEELYLLQKICRALGSNNIDSRLRQSDLSDQDDAPVFPWLGMPIEYMETLNSALLIGSNIRKEQPILNHRLRKAALRGCQVSAINMIDYAFNYDLANKLVVSPNHMLDECLGVLKALVDETGASVPQSITDKLAGITVSESHKAIAESLNDVENSAVFFGLGANSHQASSQLRTIAGLIASISNSKLGYLSEGANSTGAWLSGAVPHRLVGGQKNATPGKSIAEMLDAGLNAYFILNTEPELDYWNGADAQTALSNAEMVVAMTPYISDAMKDYADVLLPIAVFAETSGSYMNVAGELQSTNGVSAPVGEARPAWKVLRVLGNYFDLDGFDYVTSTDVLAEALTAIGDITPDNDKHWAETFSDNTQSSGIACIKDVPMNSVDAICRRSKPLQATSDIADGKLHVNSSTAASLGLTQDGMANVEQDDNAIQLTVLFDERVPDNSVYLHSANAATNSINASLGSVKVSKV